MDLPYKLNVLADHWAVNGTPTKKTGGTMVLEAMGVVKQNTTRVQRPEWGINI